MKIALTGLQIIVSVILITIILLQAKGSGLGSAFGQSQELFRTKRGMEKILHTATILLVVLFLLVSLLLVLVK